MPVKIRKLKARLAKAGFIRSGKRSHTVWEHSTQPETTVTISGKNGDDADKYQIKDVQDALRGVGETL